VKKTNFSIYFLLSTFPVGMPMALLFTFPLEMPITWGILSLFFLCFFTKKNLLLKSFLKKICILAEQYCIFVGKNLNQQMNHELFGCGAQ
jgi:hypothetical protein